MAVAKSLYLRLYLEGLKVPIQSFHVSGGVGTHVQAMIGIPPMPLIHKIKPRTLVHVGMKTSKDAKWLQVFSGEYVSYRHSEDTANRQFQLSCVGFTNYWESTFQYFLNNLDPASFAATEYNSFTTASNAKETTVKDLPESDFGNFIVQLLTRNNCDVHQGLLSVINLMANTETQNGDLSKPRINLFHERAYGVLRLGERQFMLPDDNIKKFVQTRNMLWLINKTSISLGDYCSLGQIISVFLSMVHYDWVSIVAPSYSTRGDNPGTSASPGLDHFIPGIGNSGSPRSSVSQAALALNLPETSTRVQRDVVFKPKTFGAAPPGCNLFFPGMFDKFSGGRMFLQEPTRLQIRASAISLGSGLSSEARAFGVHTYNAPKVLQDVRRVEEASLSSPDEYHTAFNQGSDVQVDSKLRAHQVLVQDEAYGIDETVTGVIPAVQEIGFAEYTSLRPDIAKKMGLVDLSASQEERDILAELNAPGSTPEKDDKIMDAHSASATQSAEGHMDNYLAASAEYRLQLARAGVRAVEGLTGPLNFNPVAGFPSLVFTRTAIYAGDIFNVNHTADCQAQAFTSVTIGNVREVDLLPGAVIGTGREKALLREALTLTGTIDSKAATASKFSSDALKLFKTELGQEFDQDRFNTLVDGFDPTDRTPVPPAWVNTAYLSSSIGSKVYAPLLGSSKEHDGAMSLFELAARGATGWIGGADNFVVAANVVFLDYLLAADRQAFIARTTTRNIATLEEGMSKFLGFKAPSEAVADKSRGFETEDLAGGLLAKSAPASITVSAGVASTGYTMPDANIPVRKVRYDAVLRFVKLISGESRKGIRG